MKVQGKGGNKGKPPKPPNVTCITDLICVRGEYVNTLSHELQPCPDCKPRNDYGPLVINQGDGVQIFGMWEENGKLFQYKYENGGYIDTWSSEVLADYINERELFYYNIGDPDRDGDKEIIILKNYLIDEVTTGKGKK